MGKFPLTWIPVVLLTSSIPANGGNYCKQQRAFRICGSSDVITFVDTAYSGSYLELDVNKFSTIAPYALRDLKLLSLQLLHPDLEHCTPKVIEITPESFEDSSTSSLVLQCIKFTVTPNPFKNYNESLQNLSLGRIEFGEMLLQFLADFPRVRWLKLSDVNMTTISPDTFSGIEDLYGLEVHDRISVIEPKSFQRFHNLDRLVLNGGQLTELRADMFDGLDRLYRLDLARNEITKLPRHVFSKLLTLYELFLGGNRISEISADTFSGLDKLQKLDLQNNSLESVPCGMFRNFTDLDFLNLRSNKITTVTSETFSTNAPTYYSFFQSLYLGSNRIHHIDPRALSRMYIWELDLSHNNLTILENDVFMRLTIATSLDLRSNNITKIEPHAFRNFTMGTPSICRHNEESDFPQWIVPSMKFKFMFLDDCSILDEISWRGSRG